MSDIDKLKAAFTALGIHGIRGYHNHSCCGNCASTDIGVQYDALPGVEKAEWHGAVFYHEQDVECVLSGGGLFLKYGALPRETYGGEEQRLIGEKLVAALKEAGLHPEWDGSPMRSVVIPCFRATKSEIPPNSIRLVRR